MIFLNIHIAIGILYLILFTLSCIDICYEFKRKYPDKKMKKSSWARDLIVIIKTIITAFIPLFNIALCWTVIFNYREFSTSVIDKLYAECISEEKKDDQSIS